ncbi:MAG: TauD/TfdA family dioxygenase [Chloroflexi bacterium]|nr:TauD/TfdA family dioxygenase [Chloroflexota bacterium]
MSQQNISEAATIPFVMAAEDHSTSLHSWLDSHREQIAAQLLHHGAILFHGFNVRALAEFRRTVTTLTPELVEQYETPTPRTEVNRQIYTSTTYPEEYPILMHNEMSHTHMWPGKIWFYCHVPATTGGETPIADSRRVYSLIDPAIRERFVDKKVMYIRNYNPTGDLLSWQQVFGVETREEAEAYFQTAGIDYEWKADGGLRTRQTRDAAIRHPVSGELVWFNQAHIFHLSNLPGDERTLLEKQYAGREEDLPYYTCYGDGSPIAAEELMHIRAAYDQAEVARPWHKGDVMLLDNVLCAHGRKPFSGARNIYVAMAEPQHSLAARQ